MSPHSYRWGTPTSLDIYLCYKKVSTHQTGVFVNLIFRSSGIFLYIPRPLMTVLIMLCIHICNYSNSSLTEALSHFLSHL